METLEELLEPYAQRTEADLRQWLIEPETPSELADAMRYCVLDGGKRLRPAMVQISAEAAGGLADEELTRRAAVSMELVHAYSLVHDDLPSMDDDTLRRGRPTAHVKFGEAMAILTGDALLTRAFAVLTESDTPLCGIIVKELAFSAGPAGMISGQVADMDLCSVPDGLDGLEFIHLRKTAAMIRGSARMGAISARAQDDVLKAISEYAESLGLAFQLVDDLLDVTGQAEEIGKTPGKDVRLGKRTHIAMIGIEAAKQYGKNLAQKAIEALAPLDKNTGKSEKAREAIRKLQRLAELLGGRTR